MSRRLERVAGEIRAEVARIVGGELKDPRLGFVTVTRVAVSPDLHSARVYVGVLGDESVRRRGLDALQHAAGFIRRAVGQRLRLRYTPEIRFAYDEGLDATERVARLLDEMPALAAGVDQAADDDSRES
jgi:ribosome-binding factor A